VNRFIGSSLVVTTISSYTLKITVATAHITPHTKSSNSPTGHTAVTLELRNSSEVNSHSRILSYPLGTDHAQKTQPLCCCMAQTTLKTNHVIAISPVHWRAECCLATSYKHLPYCCVTLSEVFIAPLPSYTRYNIIQLFAQKMSKTTKTFAWIAGMWSGFESDTSSIKMRCASHYAHIRNVRSISQCLQDMHIT
jgi:hypothetical protein